MYKTIHISNRSSHSGLLYDRQGAYLNNKEMDALVRVIAMQGTQNGDLLIVATHWPDKTTFFQKINPKNGQIKYSVGLSARTYDLTIHRMSWLPYHSTLNRAYYVGAAEYMVKEIDVATGKIIRRFGWKPPEFIPLAEKYYTDLDDKALFNEALSSSSKLARMALLDERYLIVGYFNPQGYKEFVIIYDLTAADIIPAYSLDDATVDLESLTKPFYVV